MPQITGVAGGHFPIMGVDHTAVTIFPNRFDRIAQGRNTTSAHSIEPYSFSGHLDQANWDILLPKSKILKEYVNQERSYFGLQATVNSVNFMASFLFLTAAVGLLVRAINYETDTTLRDENPLSERVRTFTDVLGYYTAPFLITIVTASVSQIILLQKRKDARKRIETILRDYKIIRKGFIYPHRLNSTYFFICEMYFELMTRDISGTFGSQTETNSFFAKLNSFQSELTERFKKLKLSYDICYGTPFLSITQFPISEILRRLKELLLSTTFLPVMDEIRKYIILHARYTDRAKISHEPIRLRADFDQMISDNPDVQTLLIQFISKISSERRRYGTSLLLRKIDLIEDTEPSAVKDALIEYWDSGKVNIPAYYAFDADLKELAGYVYTGLRDSAPWLVFDTRV